MRTLVTTLLIALLATVARAQDPKPVTEKPVTEKPVTEKPVTEKPGTEKPATEKPVTEEPVTVKPGTEKPVTGQDPKQQGQQPPATGETTEVDLPEDVPLPESADPNDLRAMKSAQEMVAAERRLRARIKAGQIKDIDKLLSFEELTSWPYEDGLKGMPKAVKELDGKQVVMIGFMLPIDEVEDIKEFLLVQSLWACCYGQPPDINGIVRVVMKGDRRCDYQFDPIVVKGTFRVEATLEDGYCIDIFQLHATEVSLVR